MKRTLLLLSLLLLSASLFSGDKQYKNEKHPLVISYFGEMVLNPGIVVGTEFDIIKTKRHDFFYTINLGSYIHPKNHIPVFLNSELGYRHNFNFGLSLDTMLGVGYFHRFVDGKVYHEKDGEIVEKPNLGMPKVMPTFSLGAGYNFSRKFGKPFSLFFKAQAFGEYPYNNYIMPHFVLQLGARIYI